MKNRVKKCASFFLAALMLITTVFGNVSTEARAEETATVAEWNYSENPALEGGKIPATSGTGYISVAGMNYTGFSSKSLSCNAVTDGAYWLIDGVNTSQCENLSFSASVRSTATGPANLALQYFDGNDWVNVENASVFIPSEKAKSLYEAFSNVILPDICCQENLCLRILVVGNASVNGKEIASSGTFNINNVIIKNSSEALTPSCDKVFAGSGSRSVLLNEEVDLHCNTEGAAIYYSINDSENYFLYDTPLKFTEDTKVSAYASKDGYISSAISDYNFTIATSGAVNATPAPGEIERGSLITLSTDNENAKIYYALGDETIGVEYTEPIVVDEDTVIRAFTKTENYKDSAWQEFAYTAVTPAGSKLTEINDGDEFVFYFGKDKKILTAAASSGKLFGVDATEKDGIISVTKTNENKDLVESIAVLKASVDADGLFTFLKVDESGNTTYLTCPAIGGGLSFEKEESDYSKWEVKASADGTFLIKNKKAYSKNKYQYLEFYSNLFTTFGWKEDSSKINYAIDFFTVPKIIDNTTTVDVSGGDISGGNISSNNNEIKELKNGDTIAIYCNGYVLSEEASGNVLKGVAASPDEKGKLTAPEKTAYLRVLFDENKEYFALKNVLTGKYLTSGATGSSLSFKDELTGLGMWKTEIKDDVQLLLNKEAKYNETSNQYVEYYSGFTTYSYKASGKTAYAVTFYSVKAPSVVDTTKVDTIARWGGSVDPADVENLYVNGDFFEANDKLDSKAVYTVVKNGQPASPQSSETYMGASPLSGENSYIQFKLSSEGYGNLSMSFRFRVTATAAKEYCLKYSTDGVNFEEFKNVPYSYSYVKYGETEPRTGKGTLENGKITLYSNEYTSFELGIPEEACDSENLYIRFYPGDKRYNGSEGAVAGNIRIDSVKIVGSPVVSEDVCGYVKANPEAGAIPVNTVLTLTDSTEDAAIFYSFDGNEYVAYDSVQKLCLETLPCHLFTYAKKDGLRDSIVSVYSYTQEKCDIPKVTPNGGGVVTGDKVKLKALTEGADCWYRFSEEDEWIAYSEPVKLLTVPCTMYVKSTKDGCIESEVKTLNFTESSGEKLNIYFGQIHSHTTISDGAGSLEEAFEHAKQVAHLDYIAVTDHSNAFDNADSGEINTSVAGEWEDAHVLAQERTVCSNDGLGSNIFTCLYGYEMTWSNGLGHMNTYNTKGFQSRTQTPYKTYETALNNYYSALEKAPDSISMFNHPGTTFGDFQDFAYYSEARDELINLIEVGNGEGAIGSSGYFPSYEYYTRALDKGWHVAPTNNQDNHKGLWGDANTGRTVVVAAANNEDEIYQAMRDHRIYATEDNDLSIYYTLDGHIMGSVLEKDDVGDSVKIVIDIADEDEENIGAVEVIVNGGLSVAKTVVNSNRKTVEFNIPSDYSYYYIKITEADGDIAVTAPVWVGKVEACGLNSVTTSVTLAVQGEAADINVDFYNNEKTDLTINKITIDVVDGEGASTTVGTFEGDAIKDVATIKSNDVGRFSTVYIYNGAGKVSYNVTAYATLNGVDKVYKDKLSLDYAAPAMVADIIIDGSHYNDYVSGYYGGNMSNFITMAANHNLRAKVVTDKITSDTLKNCKILVIASPAAKKDTSTTGDYFPSTFEDEFVDVVKEYVANGGTVVLCGLADYGNYHAAAEQNKILEAIGSTIRMNSDEVYDTVNNGGQAYRMYPENFDFESEYFNGYRTGQVYSQYSGCSVSVIDKEENEFVYPAKELVKCFDTTYSVNCKDEDGKTLKDASGNNPANDNLGDVTVLACQTTKAGGEIFVAGGVFISDFEVKAEMDNPDSLPYTNYTIAQNLLSKNEVVLPTSSIADARKGAMGEIFAVEGYVTSGTDNASTTFFDTIYIQDETAGIDIFPYAEAGLPLGKKVRIVGFVSAYQGDKELKVVSSKILDDEIKLVTPKKVSTKDAMDYDKFGGSLLTTSGTVTRVSIENGVLAEFWLKDSTGTEAAIFIDGYIYSGTTGKNTLADIVTVGQNITATGVLYMHPEGNSEKSVPVFRVRNCDEIYITRVPSNDDRNDDTETAEKKTEAATVTAPVNAVPGRRTSNTAPSTEAEVVTVETENVSTEINETELPLAVPGLKVKANEALDAGIASEGLSQIYADIDNLIDTIMNGGDYGNMVSEATALKLEKAVKEGKTITTDVSIDIITPEEFIGADKEEIENKLNEYLDGNEGAVLQFLNIEIDIFADGESLGTLNELSKEIEIKLDLKEIVPDAEYFVIRNHNGEVSILDVKVGADNTLIIKSGKFSTYALGYRIIGYNDVPLASKPVKKSVWVWSIAGASAVACLAVYIVIKKKKESEVEE